MKVYFYYAYMHTYIHKQQYCSLVYKCETKAWYVGMQVEVSCLKTCSYVKQQ